MNKKILLILTVIFTCSITFFGCGGSGSKDSASVQAPVSDGSEDLKIDFQLNTRAADSGNYFTFTGLIRYMTADKDHFDEATGASALGSTHLFHAYQYDVEGKATMPTTLRGLYLFAVNPFDQVESDGLAASKAADGTITVQFLHRGTAYGLVTDKNGNISLPNGKFASRVVGYVPSGAPQVISSDFSSDKTASGIMWNKVWDTKVASGTVVTEGVDKKTGPVMDDFAAADSMYYFDGTLKVTLENGILKINGVLTAVAR